MALCLRAVCCVDRSGASQPGLVCGPSSEAARKLGERDSDTVMDGKLDGDLIVPAAQVLHEGVTSSDVAQRANRLHSAHRPQTGLEPRVISFHPVVRVLLCVMPG